MNSYLASNKEPSRALTSCKDLGSRGLVGPFGMWIKYYASHILVCGEYIDKSRESCIIYHRSLRDELVDASVSRQDIIDMGRTHAKAGALVFHED
jgi:hypothetical protein